MYWIMSVWSFVVKRQEGFIITHTHAYYTVLVYVVRCIEMEFYPVAFGVRTSH